jgi:hypothetical protein
MFIWLNRNRTFEKKQKGKKTGTIGKTKNKKIAAKKNTPGPGALFCLKHC